MEQPRAFTDAELRYIDMLIERAEERIKRTTSPKKHAYLLDLLASADRLRENKEAKVAFAHQGLFTTCVIFAPGELRTGVTKRMTIDADNEEIGHGRALKRALFTEAAIQRPTDWK